MTGLSGMTYRRMVIGGADYLVGMAGEGPAVLLLHGFPQTHYCWRRVVPSLSRHLTVVAPDMRGYGASSAPATDGEGRGFTKREMAAELVDLMAELGHEQFAVVGHDRGARVAYRMAVDAPAHVDRLVVLNVIPTIDQFDRMGAGASLGYWPWFFLAQPPPFPERLIASAPEHFLRFIFESWAADPGAIDEAAFATYLTALTDDTISAMCADYRASFWHDRHHDAEDRRAGRRIRCPMLLITGDQESHLADAPEIWKGWSQDLTTRTVPGGHFIPEEAPEKVADALVSFLLRATKDA